MLKMLRIETKNEVGGIRTTRIQGKEKKKELKSKSKKRNKTP